jgi:dGTPase
MEWHKLLSQGRLCNPNARPDKDRNRSPFQQDIDRVTFSAAFRRLAHKTQVHPLSRNDHVHTRLTHSIEVASVGRSLGTEVGAKIADEIRPITQDQLGYVVQAACLAHDIGNPPFGHFGEDAIKSWFKKNITALNLSATQPEDFTLFDGNAQGFRIITQLEDNKGDGGLQLTHPVLGAFTKYPRSSTTVKDDYIGSKKPGFFEPEQRYFVEVADHVGLKNRNCEQPYWCRHPLAFLVEAADDICYRIIDIEDGYELDYLDFEEARDILASIAYDHPKLQKVPANESDHIGKLRAVAVGLMVDECVRVFVENKADILLGSFGSPLIELTKYRNQMATALDVAKKRIYESEAITKRQIFGAKVVSGLLDIFAEAVVELTTKASFDISQLDDKNLRLARIMGSTLKRANNTQEALLCLTDFVSGMTDRFAVDTYRMLMGIAE